MRSLVRIQYVPHSFTDLKAPPERGFLLQYPIIELRFAASRTLVIGSPRSGCGASAFQIVPFRTNDQGLDNSGVQHFCIPRSSTVKCAVHALPQIVDNFCLMLTSKL